jgi:biopolymer transport protein ExbD
MDTMTAGKVAPVPNVTPMIDVMLVLLCIFMIVTPALASGAVAEPPVAENLRPHPDDGTDHTLAIDANGSLFLDRRPISAERLSTALTDLFPAGATARVLYVRAHRELDYGTVRAALDIAGASGVAVVGLISEQRQP